MTDLEKMQVANDLFELAMDDYRICRSCKRITPKPYVCFHCGADLDEAEEAEEPLDPDEFMFDIESTANSW